MAAQSSSKSPNADGAAGAAGATGATGATRGVRVTTAAGVTRRKSVVSDPDELLLLREKLNQIAVGLQFRADDGDRTDDGYDAESERLQRRRRQQQNGSGHFKVFPLLGERPSTPPSSPQPRDVLRSQMRLRNSSFRLDDLSSHARAEDAALLGVSVDSVEVSRFESAAVAAPAALATGRLSIPGHLRVRSASSFSVLTKNPEGLRKRKSDHVADSQQSDSEDAAGPLKKVSSEKNILAATWDYDAAGGPRGNQPQPTLAPKDHRMEDAPPESPSSASGDSDMEKLCS